MTSAEIALLYPIQDSFVLPLKNEKVYRIVSPRGDFALKRYDFPWEESQYVAEAQDYIAARAPGLAPAVLRTRSGELLAATDHGQWLVSGWLPGRICDFRQAGDRMAAARALAKLHTAVRGFTRPPYHNRDKWGVWPVMMAQKQRELAEYRDDLRCRREHNRFDRRFLRFCQYYDEEIEAARSLLAVSGYEKLQQREHAGGMICHHDPAHHNFLRDGAQCGLVDFDYVLADVRAHDVASLLLKILKETDWSPGAALAALAAYDREAPLAADERRVICAILRFPQDFWQVAFARYREALVPPAKCLTKLERWTNEHTLRERALRYLAAELWEEA